MNTRDIAAEYRLSHWAGIMQERKESGLSVRAFCKNAGFHENNYFYWQRKLREATCEELARVQDKPRMIPSGFMEVRLSAHKTLSSIIHEAPSQVCIETAGLRIAASREYPIDNLVALLREVSRIC
jgi:hypothetical protein